MQGEEADRINTVQRKENKFQYGKAAAGNFGRRVFSYADKDAFQHVFFTFLWLDTLIRVRKTVFSVRI